MYAYPNWTVKRYFSEDPISKNLTMIPGGEGSWPSRATLSTAFVNPIVNAGFRVFHNVNPAESTRYIAGFARANSNLNLGTSEVTASYYFDSGNVSIIVNGYNVFTKTSINTIYSAVFDSTGRINFLEDGTSIFITDTTIDFTTPLTLVILAEVAYLTDIGVQINFDGLETKIFTDIVYDLVFVDNTGEQSTIELSVFESVAGVPIETKVFKAKSQGSIDPTSISKDNVKLYRFVRVGEDLLSQGLPDNTNKILVDSSAPWFWDSQPEIKIYVPDLEIDNLMQLVIGSTDNPILSDTVWKALKRDISSYNIMTDEAFVSYVFQSILLRSATAIELEYWTLNLSLGNYTRITFIDAIVASPEYQNATFKEIEVTYEPKVAIFKTFGIRANEVTAETVGNFCNDIYYKTQNLDALVDVDKIVNDISKMFNFELNVSQYNADEGTYSFVKDPEKVATGLVDDNQKVMFSNSNIIEELFVKMYLPEYDRYLKDINDPTLTVLASADSNSLKNLLFKNITMMNFFKGNKTQIEFLVSIFAGSLGYFIVSVEPDPYDKFVYRVTSNLPKQYWTNDIKPITHPAGWRDFYVYIPPESTAWHQIIIFSSDEIERDFIVRLPTKKHTYIDYADRYDSDGVRTRYGSYTNNAVYEDLQTEKKFPFEPNEYSAVVDFGTAAAVNPPEGLFKDLRTEVPIYDATIDYDTGESLALDSTGSSLFKTKVESGFMTFEFLRSGIATEYVWEIYLGSARIFEKKTLVPKLIFPYKNGQRYTIFLRLKNQNWRLPVFTFVGDGRSYGIAQCEFRNLNPCISGDSLSSGSLYDRFDGVSVDPNDSHKKIRYTEGDSTSVIDSTIYTSITSDATITSTDGTVTVYWNDTTDDLNLVNGIFTEYEWILRQSNDTSGAIINSFRTTLPKAIISDSNVHNVQIKFYRNDVSFVGPDLSI